nr:FAD-dependent oxidoreductase [Marinicella sp. W31]MDC2878994.1 FAD-dependent oxidoreductase [Marinicella sp. W31]
MLENNETDRPVVLLGGGHAHVEVVRSLGEHGHGRKIVLVSPSRHAPYSGMLPGYIAGRYRFEDFHIDLAALCERKDTTFLETSATGIDPGRRSVSLANGQVLGYDLLSIDIGSAPSLPAGISGGIPVKPIASFAKRLAQLDALAEEHEGPLRLAIIGHGVAGVEMAFALHERFARDRVQVTLAGRALRAVPERGKMTQRFVETALQQAGIEHYSGFDVVAFENGELVAGDGRRLPVDEAVWTTSSGAPSWLRKSGLELDAGGFIRVDATLRSVSHSNVFAAGDVASLPDPRPKAGVFAVRQGPILADNIRRSLTDETLRPFYPQRAWLALISLSNGHAIADKWGLAVSGRGVQAWKHWNDTRFVQRYRKLC